MNKEASELLNELEENKSVYKEIYDNDINFKKDINKLIQRLELMSMESKKYPYDEIYYSCGRYLVYLKESSPQTYYGNDFWYIDNANSIITKKYEISEDLRYFKIDNANSITIYDVNRKTLRKQV